MSNLIDKQKSIENMTRAIWLYPNELYPTLCHYQNAKDLAEYGLRDVPEVETERHICRECKWVKFYGNVDKNGNVESMWFCANWDGGTDEEGFCHEWESR